MKRKFNLILLFLALFIFLPINKVIGSIQLVPYGTLKYRGTNVSVMIPDQYQQKDQELRAVWVSPLVGDIAKFTSETQYKNEMNAVFDIMEYYNLNAIIYHVRIFNDALYSSELNPWSSYLKGFKVNPGWDPLPWIIEESHRRGIEFHAWLNPYRIKSSGATSASGVAAEYASIPNNAASNPENVLVSTTGAAILNPGEPAVRQFVIDTVMEIVDNYDVDAIHFDDYFYIANIDDTATMAKYNPKGLSVDNWRREQVNIFIEGLSNTIRQSNLENNRFVQLGISPTGIYKNGGSGFAEGGPANYDINGNFITNGSNTAGQEHYAAYLYADSKKWVDNEWIDYIIPQTYWAFDRGVAGYADVVDWWAKVVRNKKVNLYTGMGIYMADTETGYGWTTNPYEAPDQLLYNTKLPEVKGTSVFSFKHLRMGYYKTGKDRINIGLQVVKDERWNNNVLRPEVRTFNSLQLPIVSNANIDKSPNGNLLSWDKLQGAQRYAIFRSAGDINVNDSSQLLHIIESSNDEQIIFEDITDNTEYNYAVVAINKANKLGETKLFESGSQVDPDIIEVNVLSNIENAPIDVAESLSFYGNENEIIINNILNYRYNFITLNNKMITDQTNYGYRVIANQEFKAYFTPTDYIGVAFLNSNNDLLSFQIVISESEIVYPTPPDDIGIYTFDYWKKQVLDSGDIIFHAVYKQNSENLYLVNIIDGFSELNLDVAYGEKITLEANGVSGNFSYWLVNNTVYSYDQTLSLYVYSDLEVVAVYDSSNPINPLVYLNENVVSEEDYFIFLGRYDLPSNFALLEAGILLSNSSSQELVFDNVGILNMKALIFSPTNDFAIKKNNINAGITWYSRAYLRYLEGEEVKTIYTPIFSHVKEADTNILESIIESIPRHITSDYTFPDMPGLTFSYGPDQDESMFDLATGTHLKTRITTQVRVIQATLDGVTITFEVNFGLVGVDQKGSYYRNNPATISHEEGSSGEYFGWTGYTLTKGNDILFVSHVVEISEDNTNLKPETKLISLGFLYINVSNNNVSFNLSNIYAQNSTEYEKVVIGSDGLIKDIITSFSKKNPKIITLSPGEALWSPQYLDKQDGLTWGLNFGQYTHIYIKKYNV